MPTVAETQPPQSGSALFKGHEPDHQPLFPPHELGEGPVQEHSGQPEGPEQSADA